MGGRVGCCLLGNAVLITSEWEGRERLHDAGDRQITTSARENKLGGERKSRVRSAIRWVSKSEGKDVNVALLSGRRAAN